MRRHRLFHSIQVLLLFVVALFAGACGSNALSAANPSSAEAEINPPLLPEVSPFARSPLPVAACAGLAGDLDSAARAFRRSHPLHHQSVALGPPDARGCTPLLVSEPPPEVTIEGLAQIVGNSARDWKKIRHGIGVDGWVADAVTSLPPLDESARADLVSALHAYLFGTSYKAAAETLSGKPRGPQAKLQFRVEPGDLSSWLAPGAASFVPVLGGEPRDLGSLLSSGTPGVYLGRERGVVAWVLRRGESIDDSRFDARVFGVESDVVFGAVASKEMVAVLARERAVPTEALPPLRFETVRMLAAAETGKLSQSFERMHVAASLRPGGGDWAPIYLSEALVDSEYGGLLNIADQLLKSWSNAGTTTYEGFSYSRPSTYPFSKPIPEVLGSGDVTYNWNTTGFGWAFKSDDREIYAIGASSSLPMSYFPGDAPTPQAVALAAKAYEWFAEQEDPVIVRVASYAALFQIFRRYDVRGTPATPSDTSSEKAALRGAVRKALHDLDAADTDAIDAAVERDGRLFANWLMATKGPGYRQPAAAADRLRKSIRAAKAALSALPAGDRDARLGRIGDALATPRQLSARMALDFSEAKAWNTIMSAPDALQAFIDHEQLLAEIRRAASARSSGWIHTPAVVISSNGAWTAQGGHDVSAAVKVAPSPPKGVALGYDLTTHPGHAARSPHEALAVAGEKVSPDATRGFPREVKDQRGWFAERIDGAPSVEGGVVVTKRPDGVEIQRGKVTLRARSAVDAQEALSRLSPSEPVKLRGFTRDESRGFQTSIVTNKATRRAVTFVRESLDGQTVEETELLLQKAKVKEVQSKSYLDGASAYARRLGVPGQGEKGVILDIRVFSRRDTAVVKKAQIEAALTQIEGLPPQSSGTMHETVKGVLEKAGLYEADGIIEVDYIGGIRGQHIVDEEPPTRSRQHAGTQGHSG